MDIDGENGTVVGAITEVLTEMRIIAEVPIFAEESRIVRRMHLSEFASLLYINDETQEKLLDLFDETYPVTHLPILDMLKHLFGEEDDEESDG